MYFLEYLHSNELYRFGKKGKLAPRYIDLPPQLSRIHNAFHVSMLGKYLPSPNHILKNEAIDLQANLSYEEQPLKILEQREKKLRNRTLKFAKVQWKNHTADEATWEKEEDMKQLYHQLFSGSSTIRRTKFFEGGEEL